MSSPEKLSPCLFLETAVEKRGISQEGLKAGRFWGIIQSDEREVPLLAAVTKADEVVGVAILAPGRHLVLTDFPFGAVPVVMEAVSGLHVPGVVAPTLLADVVASVGRYPVAFQADRFVWRLDSVAADFRPKHDIARATEDHVSLLCDWLGEFYGDVREPVPALLPRRVR